MKTSKYVICFLIICLSVLNVSSIITQSMGRFDPGDGGGGGGYVSPQFSSISSGLPESGTLEGLKAKGDGLIWQCTATPVPYADIDENFLFVLNWQVTFSVSILVKNIKANYISFSMDNYGNPYLFCAVAQIEIRYEGGGYQRISLYKDDDVRTISYPTKAITGIYITIIDDEYYGNTPAYFKIDYLKLS